MGREAEAGLREGVCRALHGAREGHTGCRVPSITMVEPGPLRMERLPDMSAFLASGYGNLSPHTMAARLFCIFFALVGIPLNLVVLNRLGHCMLQGVHRCARRLGGAWKVSGPRGQGGGRVTRMGVCAGDQGLRWTGRHCLEGESLEEKDGCWQLRGAPRGGSLVEAEALLEIRVPGGSVVGLGGSLPRMGASSVTKGHQWGDMGKAQSCQGLFRSLEREAPGENTHW